MDMKTSIPRIRKVRFKSGGEIELLKTRREADEESVRKNLREVYGEMKNFNDTAGFVTLWWNYEGHWSARWVIGDSKIPPHMIPTLLANSLMNAS